MSTDNTRFACWLRRKLNPVLLRWVQRKIEVYTGTPDVPARDLLHELVVFKNQLELSIQSGGRWERLP